MGFAAVVGQRVSQQREQADRKAQGALPVQIEFVLPLKPCITDVTCHAGATRATDATDLVHGP